MKLVSKFAFALSVVITLLLSWRATVRVRDDAAMFEDDMKHDHRVAGRVLQVRAGEAWRGETGDPGDDPRLRVRRVLEIANAARSGATFEWVPNDAFYGKFKGRGLDRVSLGREVQTLLDDELASAFPVRGADRAVVGAVVVRESLADRDRFVKSAVLSTVAELVFVFVASGVLALALGRWLVGNPIRRLVEKARRTATGDFASPLTLRRSDELGELAHEMNAMCAALTRTTLELRVASRSRVTALEQLRHAERLATVGKLAAGIAHELGTPLSIVSGHAQMIAGREVEGPKVIESAEAIDREVGRIARIVKQLLQFARREGPHGTACDAAEVAERSLTLLRPMADKRRVTTTFDGAGQVRVAIDADSLQQIMTNLIVNALQAMATGGRLHVAVIRARAMPPEDRGPAADVVQIDVADDGAGMTADVLARAFEPFFTTKDPGDGTGLGLSVVHGIVEDHAGWITARSTPGAGTMMSVFLPEVAG